MLVMTGSDPYWFCDTCHAPIHRGEVVYTRASLRGHFPAPLTCCGETCASRAEATLAPPVGRMPWAAFLDALRGA